MATVSIPSASAGTPTLYKVVITNDYGTIELNKRYNDFLSLAEAVKQEMDEPVPVAPPPKQWFKSSDPQLIETRRVELEAMLRALVRSPDFYNTMAVSTFLELGKHKQAAPSKSVDWIQGYAQVSDLIAQAKSVPVNQQRKLVLEAKVVVGQLQKVVQTSNIGSGEKGRRTTQLDECLRSLSALESQSLFANSSVSMGIDGSVGNIMLSGGRDANQSSRNGNGGGRVLGETEATRRLNNSELMSSQQDRIRDQDETIEDLRRAIARQKELGLAIDEELTKQNTMLDELDSEVLHVNNRLNEARRKTTKFL